MKIGLGTVQFGLDYGISNPGGKTAEEEVAPLAPAPAGVPRGLGPGRAVVDDPDLAVAAHAHGDLVELRVVPPREHPIDRAADAVNLLHRGVDERLIELGLERHRARAQRAAQAMEWLEGAKKIV